MCSSKSFMVSSLTFKSLNHFELIFFNGVRWYPISWVEYTLAHCCTRVWTSQEEKKLETSPVS